MYHCKQSSKTEPKKKHTKKTLLLTKEQSKIDIVKLVYDFRSSQ